MTLTIDHLAINELSAEEVDDRFADLALQIEELEPLEAPSWSWGDFFGGVGVGLAVAGLFAAGVAVT